MPGLVPRTRSVLVRDLARVEHHLIISLFCVVLFMFDLDHTVDVVGLSRFACVWTLWRWESASV